MQKGWMLLPLLMAGCGKKKSVEPAAPIVGWHQEEGWLGACYFAPDFSDLGTGDRRMMRQEVLEALMEQWLGKRDDGISFDPNVIEDVETVLLGTPEKLEQITSKNTELCKTAMTGKGVDAWKTWLYRLPKQLMVGECRRPHDDTLYNYIDMGVGWQFAVDVCDDDIVQITASATDEYRVDDDGPWINSTGDLDKSTAGMSDYPCDLEGCYAGQLVLRFRGQSGAVIIKPVGLELQFKPPEHGVIDVTINDPTPFNNEFRIVRGVQHRTGVTYTSLE